MVAGYGLSSQGFHTVIDVLEQSWRFYAIGLSFVAGLAGIGLFAWLRSRLGGSGHAMLSMVLNNMTQGVVMFDAAERLVVRNERYVSMYRLSPDIVKPGVSLVDLIEHRQVTGSLTIDPAKYRADILAAVREARATYSIVETPDGRAVSVVNRPIEGGKFWIGTHDDITERIQAERKSAALSEQERRRVEIESEIRVFRESAAQVLQTVTESTSALRSIATALSKSSGSTSERTAGAVRNSSEASANMTAAAGAAEELISSIAEIGRQVSQAAELVSHSVVEARKTDEQMSRLTESVQEIGDIVNLIRNIAGQTNLLALNATIEAARAGDAGRGFAVVASEVKSLAVQTAQATEKIAVQIEAVQNSTHIAVEAIRANAERMREIDGYTSAVANALDEQDSATEEISRNVSGAAQGAKMMVAVLDEVTSAVGETRSSAGKVLEASELVEAAATGLQNRIEDFLGRVAV